MIVFEAKELQNSSETALCYRQTIPHEILHLVNYEPTQINEGPKMALMRPHPLIVLIDGMQSRSTMMITT